MDRHFLVSLTLLNCFILLALGDSIHLSSDLGLRIEWIYEEPVLQAEQVVAEQWLQDLSFGVVELTFAMHHAHLPLTSVRVSEHFLRCHSDSDLFGPDELPVAMELTEVEVASVFAASHTDEVTVAMACAKVPLSSILHR